MMPGSSMHCSTSPTTTISPSTTPMPLAIHRGVKGMPVEQSSIGIGITSYMHWPRAGIAVRVVAAERARAAIQPVLGSGPMAATLGRRGLR